MVVGGGGGRALGAATTLLVAVLAGAGCGSSRPAVDGAAPGPPTAATAVTGDPGTADPRPGDPGAVDPVPGGGGPRPDARGAGPDRLPHQLDGSLRGSDGAGLRGAALIVSHAAARVNVRTTDLPGLLYRITTPAGSGLAPQVTGGDGVVRLGLRPTGDDGPDTVDILLNRTVRWRIRLSAGGGEQHLDLSTGRIRRVDLGAGVGLIRMRLPRPLGVVPIRLTGSVGSAQIDLPRAVPMRMRLVAGASAVSVPAAGQRRIAGSGRSPRGAVPAGTVLTSPGRGAAGRYRVDTLGPIDEVTVRTR